MPTEQVIDQEREEREAFAGVLRFYDLAKRSYCVIQTGERRFYGCFVFKKGVIAPDDR